MVVPKHKAKHVNSCTTSMPSHSWFRLLKSPVVCGPQKSITSHTHKCTKTYHTLIYCRSGFRHILFGTWDHSSSCGRTLVAVHMYESPRERFWRVRRVRCRQGAFAATPVATSPAWVKGHFPVQMVDESNHPVAEM